MYKICSTFNLVYGYGSVTESQQLKVIFNETVVLKCNFDGVESRMIYWLRNGIAIDFVVSMQVCITIRILEYTE